MVLQSINENKAWTQMNWKCSFIMQWPNMLYGTKSMLSTFQDPEVMAGDMGAGGQRVNPSDNPEERGMLRLRGYNNIFKGQVSIVMHCRTNDVTVTIPKSMGFGNDYESLSKAIGPFVDSLELRMFTAK